MVFLFLCFLVGVYAVIHYARILGSSGQRLSAKEKRRLEDESRRFDRMTGAGAVPHRYVNEVRFGEDRISAAKERRQERSDSVHAAVFPMDGGAEYLASDWFFWPDDVHETYAALDRQKRALFAVKPAVIDTTRMEALFFPTFPGISIVYRTTLHTCTCPDFQRRKLPCKHIYRLFFEMSHLPLQNPELQVAADFPFLQLSPEEQYLFLQMVLDPAFQPLQRRTKAVSRFAALGLISLTQNHDPDEYRLLLEAMTKRELLDALSAHHISGFYPSWPKDRLVYWTIVTQPGFLRSQFGRRTLVWPTAEILPWLRAVIRSDRSYRSSYPDEDLRQRAAQLYIPQPLTPFDTSPYWLPEPDPLPASDPVPVSSPAAASAPAAASDSASPTVPRRLPAPAPRLLLPAADAANLSV